MDEKQDYNKDENLEENIKESKKEKSFLDYLRKIFSSAFLVVLVIFLVTLLIGEIFPNLLNSLVNCSTDLCGEEILAWMLFLIIVLGILNIIFPTRYFVGVEKQVVRKDFVLIVLLGTLIGFNVFLRLKETGWIGYLIGLIAGLAVISVLILVLIKKRRKIGNKNLEDKKKI
jgi:MFS family permease